MDTVYILLINCHLQEREERKVQAEIRRAAVVERLRKQAEAEERRKQEILDRLLHEENEKQRLVMVRVYLCALSVSIDNLGVSVMVNVDGLMVSSFIMWLLRIRCVSFFAIEILSTFVGYDLLHRLRRIGTSTTYTLCPTRRSSRSSPRPTTARRSL